MLDVAWPISKGCVNALAIERPVRLRGLQLYPVWKGKRSKQKNHLLKYIYHYLFIFASEWRLFVVWCHDVKIFTRKLEVSVFSNLFLSISCIFCSFTKIKFQSPAAGSSTNSND